MALIRPFRAAPRATGRPGRGASGPRTNATYDGSEMRVEGRVAGEDVCVSECDHGPKVGDMRKNLDEVTAPPNDKCNHNLS